MTNPAYEINKVAEDVVVSLTRLDREISSSRGSDVDYRPNETTQKAYDSLQKLNSMLKGDGERVTQLRGRGNVVDALIKIEPKLDSPSVQTMLGTMAVELSGMLRMALLVLREKDPKKVEGTSFEGLYKKN